MQLDASDLKDPNVRDVHAGRLRGFLRAGLARSFGHQLSDADLDELTQVTLVKVLDRLDSFEGRSKLSTWAMSIGTREALQRLRRRKFQHVSLEDAVEKGAALFDAPRAPRDLQHAALYRLLHEGIRTVLSESQRTALEAELGGLPLAEIALRQGRSRGALYKSLHDARRKLGAYLAEHGVTAADLER